MVKKKRKKKIIGFFMFLIRPFIIPIIFIVIILALICSITDILYIAFNNDDKIDMKQELAYYDIEYEKEKSKEETLNFFQSVWSFTNGIFGTDIAEYTEWPVERILRSK